MKDYEKKDCGTKGTKITSDQAKQMLKEKGNMVTKAEKGFLGILANPTGKRMDQQPSSNISSEKAKQMLKEGEAHGKPLTEKQKGMLGAAAEREKS